MNRKELELVIKRLDKDLGFTKEQIKEWLFKPCFNYTNCSPIDYLNFNMGWIIFSHIDLLKENKDVYF